MSVLFVSSKYVLQALSSNHKSCCVYLSFMEHVWCNMDSSMHKAYAPDTSMKSYPPGSLRYTRSPMYTETNEQQQITMSIENECPNQPITMQVGSSYDQVPDLLTNTMHSLFFMQSWIRFSLEYNPFSHLN